MAGVAIITAAPAAPAASIVLFNFIAIIPLRASHSNMVNNTDSGRMFNEIGAFSGLNVKAGERAESYDSTHNYPYIQLNYMDFTVFI